jgi:hypothetical protein
MHESAYQRADCKDMNAVNFNYFRGKIGCSKEFIPQREVTEVPNFTWINEESVRQAKMEENFVEIP